MESKSRVEQVIEAIHGERTPTELRSLGLLPLMSESEAIPFYLESIACFLKAAFLSSLISHQSNRVILRKESALQELGFK